MRYTLLIKWMSIFSSEREASYSELYFTPVLWPDFTEEELKKAVDWFEGRDRRFGGLTEEN